LRDGVAAGAIDAICSDHQPHEDDAKLNPFGDTEPGISSLETLLPLGLQLVTDQTLKLSELIEKLTWQPAGILGINHGQLAPGSVADICIFDPEQTWFLEKADMISHGRNSPFIGRKLKGRVSYTLLEGHLVYKAAAITSA
jgi:dihydroorotase